VATAVTAQDASVRFDRVLARSVLADVPDAAAWLADLLELTTPEGAMVVAEVDTARAQRLSALVDWHDAGALAERVRQAEAALYADAAPWDEARWQQLAAEAGLRLTMSRDVVVHGDQRLGTDAVAQWLGTASEPGRYARALRTILDADEVEDVARRYRTRFTGQVVPWRTVVGVARFERPPAR
jgi:hypothetical protein